MPSVRKDSGLLCQLKTFTYLFGNAGQSECVHVLVDVNIHVLCVKLPQCVCLALKWRHHDDALVLKMNLFKSLFVFLQ